MPLTELVRTAARPVPAVVACAVAGAAAATILGALFIEHVLGVKPCDLCLTQRIPYYAGIPLALAVGVLAVRGGPTTPVRAGLALLAILFLGGAGLGAYHAGVEFGWWPGPTGCTGAVARPAGMGDFLKQLETVRVVRCDEVAIRVLGLSLAAWNAVISLGLSAMTAAALGRR